MASDDLSKNDSSVLEDPGAIYEVVKAVAENSPEFARLDSDVQVAIDARIAQFINYFSQLSACKMALFILPFICAGRKERGHQAEPTAVTRRVRKEYT